MQLTEHIVQLIEQLPKEQQAELFQYILVLEKENRNQAIESLLKYLPQIVGVIAFGFGVFQYTAAQKWKRLEYVASVLSKINIDEDLMLAVTFLDWRKRDIFIPQRFLANHDEEKWFQHTHLRMAEAFDLNNREPIIEHGNVDLKIDHLNIVNIVYVETFDKFFLYLGQINDFIKMGLIKFDDVTDLNYLLNRINSLKVNGKYVFRDYLRHYEFNGVLDLIEKSIPLGV